MLNLSFPGFNMHMTGFAFLSGYTIALGLNEKAMNSACGTFNLPADSLPDGFPILSVFVLLMQALSS